MCMRYRQTIQCKQEAGKKHSDPATRTLNNGHLMGTHRNDKHAAGLYYFITIRLLGPRVSFESNRFLKSCRLFVPRM